MSNLLKSIIDFIDSKKGEDIKVLDFQRHSPFIDYFVIVSALNNRHALSLIDDLEDFANKNDLIVNSKDAIKDSNWMLIDINNIVVHVFVGEDRDKYNLEGLWKDLVIQN